MAAKRKFYKTIVTVTVLSEDSYPTAAFSELEKIAREFFSIDSNGRSVKQ